MKRAVMIVALSTSLILALSGAAKSAEAEALVFQVKCVFPEFPAFNSYTSCSGGLGDIGAGTAFNRIASPELKVDVFFEDRGCEIGRASGWFSINGISGEFYWDRTGTDFLFTFLDFNGQGFTNGVGQAVGTLTPTTLADAQKIANACRTGLSYLNVGVTLTGIGQLRDTT